MELGNTSTKICAIYEGIMSKVLVRNQFGKAVDPIFVDSKLFIVLIKLSKIQSGKKLFFAVQHNCIVSFILILDLGLNPSPGFSSKKNNSLIC